MNELIVRPYEKGDENGIVELLQLGFDGWPKFDLHGTPLDYWRWKYNDNPLHDEKIPVSVSGDRVVGAALFIPLRVKIEDQRHPCAYWADIVIHPDFRKMGLVGKLVDFLDNRMKEIGVKFCFLVTRNPILIKWHLKQGWALFPHQVVNFVRILDIDLHLKAMPMKRAWAMKTGYQASKFLNDFRNLFNMREHNPPTFSLSKVSRFDDKIEVFWDVISEGYDFIVERDRDFLNWRYCDPRGGFHTVKIAEEGGEVLGYIVTKINRLNKEYPVGYVVDLLTLPGRPDVADALVADAVHQFNDERINLIHARIVKKHVLMNAFTKHGFLDSRIKSYIFCLGEEAKRIKMIPTKRVHFAYGDVD